VNLSKENFQKYLTSLREKETNIIHTIKTRYNLYIEGIDKDKRDDLVEILVKLLEIEQRQGALDKARIKTELQSYDILQHQTYAPILKIKAILDSQKADRN
jgi:hypothetical protein